MTWKSHHIAQFISGNLAHGNRDRQTDRQTYRQTEYIKYIKTEIHRYSHRG